jgi:hypothetical protein
MTWEGIWSEMEAKEDWWYAGVPSIQHRLQKIIYSTSSTVYSYVNLSGDQKGIL